MARYTRLASIRCLSTTDGNSHYFIEDAIVAVTPSFRLFSGEDANASLTGTR